VNLRLGRVTLPRMTRLERWQRAAEWPLTAAQATGVSGVSVEAGAQLAAHLDAATAAE